MVSQMQYNPKYLRDILYQVSLEGARIRPVPITPYTTVTDKAWAQYENFGPYHRAQAFMDSTQEGVGNFSIDDIFHQKLTLAEDRTSLILNEILEKDVIHKANLSSLYEELFMINQWRSQRSFPENYLKDKTWMEWLPQTTQK